MPHDEKGRCKSCVHCPDGVYCRRRSPQQNHHGEAQWPAIAGTPTAGCGEWEPRNFKENSAPSTLYQKNPLTQADIQRLLVAGSQPEPQQEEMDTFAIYGSIIDIADACLCYDHAFGLFSPIEQEHLRNTAVNWLRAFAKAKKTPPNNEIFKEG
jgi:hypothetical protein